MVYFSAHWCPPCRQFTPVLSEFYKNLKKTNSNFELVFASSDKDESAFNEYYGEMPFLALPFSERSKKEALSKKFGVKGIPMLVVVAPDGSTVTTEGRKAVSEDPTGAAFPWLPKSFEEILPKQLLAKGGEMVDAKGLDDKVLMLYFSVSGELLLDNILFHFFNP